MKDGIRAKNHSNMGEPLSPFAMLCKKNVPKLSVLTVEQKDFPLFWTLGKLSRHIPDPSKLDLYLEGFLKEIMDGSKAVRDMRGFLKGWMDAVDGPPDQRRRFGVKSLFTGIRNGNMAKYINLIERPSPHKQY